MTSNLGAAYLNESANGIDGPVPTLVKQNVMATIQGHFPPEFVNRIDEIIVFRPLGRSSVGKIVDLRLREVQERLVDRKITLDVEPAAREYLGARGYSPSYGARPLQRAIQSELLNPLSMLILGERILPGETVRVVFDAPHNRVVVVPNHEGNGEEMDVDDLDEPEIVEMD
jgi:ATP-dependent Clp protease ATP-binding subunit ClpB